MAKSALLIGEKSDIGATIKTYLKKEGYVVTGTTSSTLDLSSKESVDNFLLKNNKKFNSIIFVAATNTPKKFLNLEDKDFDYSYDVNFKSFVFILKNLISPLEWIMLFAVVGGGFFLIFQSKGYPFLKIKNAFGSEILKIIN